MKYAVEQYIVSIDTYIVEAEDKAEAIQKVFDGDTLSDYGTVMHEYVEVDEDRGMLCEEDPELAEDLVGRGTIAAKLEHIPSIRSVTAIGETE